MRIRRATYSVLNGAVLEGSGIESLVEELEQSLVSPGAMFRGMQVGVLG